MDLDVAGVHLLFEHSRSSSGITKDVALKVISKKKVKGNEEAV